MPDLPPQLEIHPIPPFGVDQPLVVRLPGSKSLTNRALLIAALAQGPSKLTHVLFADDTRRMMEALETLGVVLEIDEPNQTVTVHGCGGRFPTPADPDKPVELFLGNAGTAMRFLTAACCLGRGTFRLDGIERMRQRPIGELVEPLRQLGADITYEKTEGYPPLLIRANGLLGGALTMKPTLSSQFISALLQIAPLLKNGLSLTFDGPVTSWPYVRMTLDVIAHFSDPGAEYGTDQRIEIPASGYTGKDWGIEPDASNASYFLAAALAAGGACTITGLTERSRQGDARFVDVLERMGGQRQDHDGDLGIERHQALRGIDVDLNDMPDTAQTLGALAILADPGSGPTTIRNIGNLRVKETDRLAAMKTELEKLGAAVRIDGDDITITPPPGGQITPAMIDTYDDHRMAMSFAVIGLARPGVVINDPACVNKTFPGFWRALNQLGPAVDLPAGLTATEAGA